MQYYCYIIVICYIVDCLFPLIFKLNNTFFLYFVLASYFRHANEVLCKGKRYNLVLCEFTKMPSNKVLFGHLSIRV